jgi:hypothetical protein
MVAAACGAAVLAAPAAAQLRVVSYNIAQLQGDDVALEAVLAAAHADDRPGFAVPVGVFVFQEVRSTDLPILQDLIDNAAPPGVSYSLATFTSAPGEDDFGGAQALFYRSDRLFEITASHVDIYSGAGRYTDRWQFRLLNYPSPAITFLIYSSHLKAGSAAQDEAERLDGAQNVRTNADALGPGQHILYVGDLNAASNADDGYLHFLSPGPGQAIDPLGSNSWAGPGNAIKHSQSPRLVACCGLIGGGVDDRFDFQLSTLSFHDGLGLSIIPGTYRSLGNDGQHFDLAINDGNNFYYPGNVPRSNQLADDLHDASDHVPLLVEYQVPALISAIAPSSFGRLIVGASHSALLLVSNVAPADVSQGADMLDYVATAAGGLSGVSSDSVAAQEPGPSVAFFPVNTAAPGPVAGTITVVHNSEGVANSQSVFNVAGSVVRHANPSFSATIDLDSLLAEIEVEPDSGVHQVQVDVYNIGFDALQAALDVDSVSGLAAPFAFVGGLTSNIGAGSAALIFSFDTTGLADGIYEAAITINTSDENLPGAANHAIQLAIQATVGSPEACPADCADGDGTVNVNDLLALLAQWGADGACDLSGNGTVDVNDLLALLAAWGNCP